MVIRTEPASLRTWQHSWKRLFAWWDEHNGDMRWSVTPQGSWRTFPLKRRRTLVERSRRLMGCGSGSCSPTLARAKGMSAKARWGGTTPGYLIEQGFVGATNTLEPFVVDRQVW